MKLGGKVVFVTGSSRGIGKAIAMEFARYGCRVVINASKSAEELEQCKKEIEQKHGICHAILGDVSSFAAVSAMFEEIKGIFGPVNILVNNAGISYMGLFTDMEPEAWQRVIDINLGSVLHCTRLALPYMIRVKEGVIINISSMWGTEGASCEAVYSASKGAVNAFTKAIAKEVGPSGIRVNAIACGVIDTKMNACFSEEEASDLKEGIALGRFGKAEEVARLAAFLADKDAAFIHGQIITIDGCML